MTYGMRTRCDRVRQQDCRNQTAPLRRKRQSMIKLPCNKCNGCVSSSSHRLKSAGALIMQLRPSLYLPVATTTSNRVRTKILELIGVKPQISSKYNFKNLRNYLHISNIFYIFALDFKSVLFPVWSNRINPATAST